MFHIFQHETIIKWKKSHYTLTSHYVETLDNKISRLVHQFYPNEIYDFVADIAYFQKLTSHSGEERCGVIAFGMTVLLRVYSMAVAVF